MVQESTAMPGYGMAHSNVKFGTLTGSEAGLTNAVNNALADAGMTIDDIDAVFGFANGMKAVDDVEIKGLTAVFGDKLAEKPVVELKEVLGESRAQQQQQRSTRTYVCWKDTFTGSIQHCSRRKRF